MPCTLSVLTVHVGEVQIDAALVERPLEQWPGPRGPLRRVRPTGTVNAIYRVGEEHYVRLPRHEQYVGDLRKELEWLPRLDVSLPIPEPVFGRLGRAAYRDALEVDDATWERARGIALHQAAMIIPYYRESNPAFTALAERTVAQITQG